MEHDHPIPVFGCSSCIALRDSIEPTLEQVLEQDLTKLLDEERDLSKEEWWAEIHAMYEFYVAKGLL